MESIIEKLEMILKEIKQWEHEPRPNTVAVLDDLSSQMYHAIF